MDKICFEIVWIVWTDKWFDLKNKGNSIKGSWIRQLYVFKIKLKFLCVTCSCHMLACRCQRTICRRESVIPFYFLGLWGWTQNVRVWQWGTVVKLQSLSSKATKMKGCTNLQIIYEQRTIVFIITMQIAKGLLGMPFSCVNSEDRDLHAFVLYSCSSILRYLKKYDFFKARYMHYSIQI